jgi:hypothetical protein
MLENLGSVKDIENKHEEEIIKPQRSQRNTEPNEYMKW